MDLLLTVGVFLTSPVACYLYLIPLCYSFSKQWFCPAKTETNEVTTL